MEIGQLMGGSKVSDGSKEFSDAMDKLNGVMQDSLRCAQGTYDGLMQHADQAHGSAVDGLQGSGGPLRHVLGSSCVSGMAGSGTAYDQGMAAVAPATQSQVSTGPNASGGLMHFPSNNLPTPTTAAPQLFSPAMFG